MTGPPKETNQNIWSARLDVVPENGNDIFDGDPGAYTNFVARAETRAQFEEIAREVIESMGLRVIRIEACGIVRTDEPQPGTAAQLIEELGAGNPWAYDTFYVYQNE